MSISSLLVPAILFFALGMFACIIKSDLKFPPDMHKMIVIYLLIGIGLHGGKALATSNMGDALPAVWAALASGLGYRSLPTLSCAPWARSIRSMRQPYRPTTVQ